MAWFSGRIAEKLGLSPGTLVYIGDKPSQAPRVTLVQYKGDEYTMNQAENFAQLEPLIRPDLRQWIHVEGLHDIRLVEAVGKKYQIHQMSLEDILNSHHRPKMSDFETYIHFVVKVVGNHPKTGRLQFEHASVILGNNFVLSFCEKRSDFLKPIFERFANPKGRLRNFASAYLAFSLLDLVIDHFYLALSRLESAVDEMETKILHTPSDPLLSQLYEVKRETALVRKMAVPIRDFIRSLIKNNPSYIEEQFEIYYRDLEDHAIQIVDTCESLKETLRNLLDVSDSYSTHNTNVMFKFFTAVSAIFLPLNFLASVYGMNFHHMPGLDDPAGFYITAGVMVMIALFVALYFRIKKWW